MLGKSADAVIDCLIFCWLTSNSRNADQQEGGTPPTLKGRGQVEVGAVRKTGSERWNVRKILSAFGLD